MHATSAKSSSGRATEEEDLPALAPPREGSGAWRVPRDLRASALSWMAGRGAWRLADALSWTHENLVEPQYLTPSRGTEPIPFFWERDVGLIRTRTSTRREEAAEAPGFALDAREFPHLLEVAHARVRSALRGLLERGANDAFVHAAIYGGRVWREPIGGRRFRWGLRLTCDVPMSEQVLALFAADLLARRDAYDEELAVCEECGAIAFEPSLPHWRRFGCIQHPDPLRHEESLLRA